LDTGFDLECKTWICNRDRVLGVSICSHIYLSFFKQVIYCNKFIIESSDPVIKFINIVKRGVANYGLCVPNNLNLILLFWQSLLIPNYFSLVYLAFYQNWIFP
jgi:hypothetical protein